MKPTLRFFRHGGIYRSDAIAKTWGRVPPPVSRPRSPVQEREEEQRAPLIVRDEFRPAIPRAGRGSDDHH